MRTKDHVVPKSKGGRKIVLACIRCNAAKRDLSLEEFRALRGGIEFWGERAARLEAEKIGWIYYFNPADHTIHPVECSRSDFAPKPPVLPNTLPDLRGVKFGGLTVTKWLPATGRWEVVCMCGEKEVRTTKAIRNPANTFDACLECRRPIGKLRSDIFKETGVEVTWEECFQHIYGGGQDSEKDLSG